MDLLIFLCMRTGGVCNGSGGASCSLSGFVLRVLNLCQNTIGPTAVTLPEKAVSDLKVGLVAGWVSVPDGEDSRCLGEDQITVV